MLPFVALLLQLVVVLIAEKCVWNIDSSGYMYSGGWETFTTVYISLTQKASIYVQVQYVWYNSISSGSAWKPVIDNTFSF